ncbi:hypothetical protein [Streptomyces lutosisoli]|uniref:Uncharacterized protein n=1 Tax=Streptomyces lutosisoli TaxID=2665721 RepID=A0ABW2VMZ6_9ACTN
MGARGRRDPDRGGTRCGDGVAPVLYGCVDRAQRPPGCGQDVRIAVARSGAGDQAVELKPDQALPGEAVVQSCLFGDVDEPHGPARVEDLDHGG